MFQQINVVFCVILVLLFYFSLNELPFHDYYSRYSYDKNVCGVESWNEKTTLTIPNVDILRKLVDKRRTADEGLSDGELRLLSAYLYHDEIVVTTTRQRESELGKTIYCRYYACNRVEIPNSTFESFMFPMTAVHCARRAGANFISLSFNNITDVAAKPIPFVKRLDEKPPHNLGVCVGQIYGPSKKWIDLVEFVEHHKIIGATMFYFTVFSIDEYSRTALNEYIRTGYAEVTDVNTEYTDGYLYMHMIQIHDCFFRSRYHSKWMLNIDHDEFLVPNRKGFLEYIDSLSAHFAEIIFAIRRKEKTEKSAEVFENTESVGDNIQMIKYNRTLNTWYRTSKVIVQPTKLEAILLHWAYGRLPGYRSLSIPKHVALVNHYRNRGMLPSGPNSPSKQFTIDVVDKNHTELLKTRVTETVEYVFKKHNISCESISDTWKTVTLDFLKKMKIC